MRKAVKRLAKIFSGGWPMAAMAQRKSQCLSSGGAGSSENILNGCGVISAKKASIIKLANG